MNNTIFILNTVAPIFLLVIVGWILRKRGIVKDSFIKQSTKFVFNVTLPTLIFLKLVSVDFSQIFESKIIILTYIGIILTFLVGWSVARVFIKKGRGRSIFIQGSYWPNNVILGLALIINIFGEEGAAKAVLILTFMVPLNNLLSVFTLSVFDKSGKLNSALFQSLISIVKNPVIIAGVIAIIFSNLHFPLPTFIYNTGKYLADVSLPLALIGIGGSLRFAYLKQTSTITLGAVIIKLIFSPMLAVTLGLLMGYSGIDLGIIFILFACPTAILSYIFAEAMTPHGEIAGNIVITSTLISAITIPIGLILLKYLNLL